MHPPRISPEDWKRHEATIKDLYYSQDLPLQSKAGKRNLVQVMREEHNFSATPSQYEGQFNKWDSSKNVNKGEWKLILAQIDHLGGQDIRVRVRVSGQVIKKDRLKRARRWVQPESNGSCVPSSAWLSMPEYCHISMEIQGADGEWSKYLPSESPELARGVNLPASQSHDPTFDFNSTLDLNMEDVRLQSTDHRGVIDSHDALSQPEWSIIPRAISPWRIGAYLPLSPGAIFSSTTELQCESHENQKPVIDLPEILLQPPPSYQLGLHAHHQNQIVRVDHPIASGARLFRVPNPAALALPTAPHFVSLLLQDARVVQQDKSIWWLNTQLPRADQLMSRLQSLSPESMQALEIAPTSTNIEHIFPDIIIYSIANGFAGFRDVPIGSIFRLLRSQPQMSAKMLEYLRNCPAVLARSFTDNLFRAAIEACDVQAVSLIIHITKDSTNAIHPDEIACEFQGRKFTPLELAAKLRSREIVEILLKLGADVNKTYEKDKTGERGPLELAIRKYVILYEPIDLNLVRALLRAGAKVRDGLVRSVAHSCPDPQLQNLLFDRISPRAHGVFFLILPYLTNHLENDQAFRITSQLFRFCEEAECFQCITKFSKWYQDKETRLLSMILSQAAKRGNFDLCEFLLKYIDAEDVVLSAAIRSGDRAVIDLVVQHGAGVQGEARPIDLEGRAWRERIRSGIQLTTPLAEAIQSQDASLMLIVERLGAWNCLKQKGHLRAAIFAAVDVNDTNMVAKLLPDIPSPLGYGYLTAFSRALEQQNTSIASLLLANGIGINDAYTITGSVRTTPFLEALKYQNAEILDIILETDVSIGIYPEGGPEVGSAPMELAALWGDVSIIKDLIYMGFPIDDGRTSTALAAAVKSRDMELVDLLLASGADPSASAVKGVSPLCEAVQNADGKWIQHLLSKGTNPADSDAFIEAIDHQKSFFTTLLSAFTDRYPLGCTRFGADLLIKAIETDNRELLQALIEAKMDVNGFVSKRRCTPLGFAIRHWEGSSLESLRRLLAAGANANAIAAAPFSRGIYQEPALLVAINTSNEKMVSFILENGGDVNQAARRGVKRTPLQKACEIGSLEIVKLLLDWGANINDPPARNGGGTALQLASGTGSISIVQLLLSRGADVHAPTSVVEGRSALEYAAENGCIDIVKILWDATYSVGFQVSEVERAVSFARKRGHRGCAEYIRKLQAASDWVLSQSSALAGIP